MFDFLGGLFSGIGSVTSAYMQNQQSQQNLQQSQAFNQQEAIAQREFNATQAGLNRDFQQASQDAAMNYNTKEAQKSRDFSANQQVLAERYNTEESQKARDFLESMSGSAYQRAMKDMKAAGLNPILAYQQGGASTPGAPSASIGPASGHSASVGSLGGSQASGAAAVSPGYAQAVGLFDRFASTAAEIAKLKPSIENIEEDTIVKSAQKNVGWASAGLLRAQREKVNAETDNVKAQRDVIRRGAEIGKLDEDFYSSKFGGISRYIGNAMREFNPFVSNAKTLNEMYKGD